MTEDAPLSLEAYVLALAHLLRHRREPIANVLGSLAITGEAFRQAEAHWTRELAQTLPRKKGMLAMTFATRLAEAREKVGLLDPFEGAMAPPPASKGSGEGSPWAHLDAPPGVTTAAPAASVVPEGMRRFSRVD